MDKSVFLEQLRWLIIFGAVVSVALIAVGAASLIWSVVVSHG